MDLDKVQKLLKLLVYTDTCHVSRQTHLILLLFNWFVKHALVNYLTSLKIISVGVCHCQRSFHVFSPCIGMWHRPAHFGCVLDVKRFSANGMIDTSSGLHMDSICIVFRRKMWKEIQWDPTFSQFLRISMGYCNLDQNLPFIRFISQLHATIFTHITVNVEVLIHRNNPYRFFSALHRCYTWNYNNNNKISLYQVISNIKKWIRRGDLEWKWFTFATAGALWCKHAMIVINTVNFIIHIDGEWNAVQAFIADTASEAARMIRFSHGL